MVAIIHGVTVECDVTSQALLEVIVLPVAAQQVGVVTNGIALRVARHLSIAVHLGQPLVLQPKRHAHECLGVHLLSSSSLLRPIGWKLHLPSSMSCPST